MAWPSCPRGWGAGGIEGRAVIRSPLPLRQFVELVLGEHHGFNLARPVDVLEHPVPLICRHDKAGVVELDAGKFKRFEVLAVRRVGAWREAPALRF